MNLCKYKDIFGKPNKGIHSYRLFNFAIVDVLATVFVAYIIAIYYKCNFMYTLFVLFVLGIFMHHIFCVNTQISKLLTWLINF